jgi:hypothetical protein
VGAVNASGLANRSYEQIAAEILAAAAVDAAEDEQFGEAPGDELPPELPIRSSRKARLREAKARLEAEAAAEHEAYDQMISARAEREARTGGARRAGRRSRASSPTRRRAART